MNPNIIVGNGKKVEGRGNVRAGTALVRGRGWTDGAVGGRGRDEGRKVDDDGEEEEEVHGMKE